MKGERDGKGAMANENIETNISGEILQFSRALNFTLHIKRQHEAAKAKGNGKRVLPAKVRTGSMTWTASRANG